MTLDRPRGILSPSDRKYLDEPDKYKEEHSPQAAHDRRQAIIERVHEALHDFPLLVHELAEDQRREAFEDRDLDGKEPVINILSYAFAFLNLGITDIAEPSDLAKDMFEDMIEGGLRQAYLQRGVSVADVTVEIEVTLGEPLDKLKNRDELSYPEVNQLLESGALSELSGDEKMDLIQQSLESGRTDKVGAYPNLNANEPEESNDAKE